VNVIDRPTIERFRRQVLDWGARHRRAFFWRSCPLGAYELLVIEILLARTRAESVEPVATRLLERYPTVEDLAAADPAEVAGILYPLGLYRKRSRALVYAARAIRDEHDGMVPTEVRALLRLPYVGRYAAHALICFKYGKRCAVVDANVARVLRRFFALDAPTRKLEHEELYWMLAQRLVPRGAPREYNWSLLDLGALVCKPIRPRCSECPLATWCNEARLLTSDED